MTLFLFCGAVGVNIHRPTLERGWQHSASSSSQRSLRPHAQFPPKLDVQKIPRGISMRSTDAPSTYFVILSRLFCIALHDLDARGRFDLDEASPREGDGHDAIHDPSRSMIRRTFPHNSNPSSKETQDEFPYDPRKVSLDLQFRTRKRASIRTSDASLFANGPNVCG